MERRGGQELESVALRAPAPTIERLATTRAHLVETVESALRTRAAAATTPRPLRHGQAAAFDLTLVADRDDGRTVRNACVVTSGSLGTSAAAIALAFGQSTPPVFVNYTYVARRESAEGS